MTEVGIDTSVLIGLLDPRDVWHNAATALKEALQAHQANITVFDCVLAEAISTMPRRIHEQRDSSDKGACTVPSRKHLQSRLKRRACADDGFFGRLSLVQLSGRLLGRRLRRGEKETGDQESEGCGVGERRPKTNGKRINE
jgi:hypothetical protein